LTFEPCENSLYGNDMWTLECGSDCSEPWKFIHCNVNFLQ